MTPDSHGIAVLLLIVVALILFTRRRLPLESSSLAVLVVLAVGFELFPYDVRGEVLEAADFLHGFGHEALVAICSLVLIGKALETTGALQPLARLVAGMMASRPRIALLLMLLMVATASAFVNDTPIVVLMIPVIVGVAVGSGLPLSSMLLPMGLATIIGGMTTTIGTSTNLLVSSIGREMGAADIGMFDFVLPAVIVGVVGILFVWLVAPRILPNRSLPMEEESHRMFSAELHITDESPAAGRYLSDVLAMTEGEMRVERIQRGDTLELARLPSLVIQSGDRLLVRDNPGNLKRFERKLGATFVDDNRDGGEREELLAEVVVTQDSPLYRRSLTDADLATGVDVVPIAVHRSHLSRNVVRHGIENLRLRTGDVLLLQGTRAAMEVLRESSRLLVLDGSIDLPPRGHSGRALAVLAMVVLSAAAGLLPIAVSALIGVGLMIALKCLTWRDARAAVPVSVIMLIVASLGLGKALVATGMAEYVAGAFVNAAEDLPAPVILSLFLLTMAVLTNIVSNNAAAVIGTPIAVATSQQLGADPMPFLLAVLFGANMSFVTPFGYQTNLLILNAGNYRVMDFVKVGLPLALVMWLGFSIVLPLMYELTGFQTGES
ncbi:MAG: SLC13 family permease [Proteobacteria bacterium]|nr:SLC13 family permease [Pseudomonadota bacterium]